MMVTARKVEDSSAEVKYQFGLDRAFDRTLIINRQRREVRTEDGDFDTAASVITAKIMRVWQNEGEYPRGMVFCS